MTPKKTLFEFDHVYGKDDRRAHKRVMAALKKKTPRAAPRARSGKHLHAGVLVRAPDAEREAWARAAELSGLARSEWLRRIANATAARQLSQAEQRDWDTRYHPSGRGRS